MKSVCKNTVMVNLVVLVIWFFVTGGFPLQVLGAKPKFSSYELKAKHEEIFFPDFDGDGLDDIIAIDEPNLLFFFQDAKRGFAKNPDLVYSFGDKPSVIWPAKLGNNPGRNILVMTNDGVSILTYVDKKTPPAMRKIINQQTIIPEKCENSPTILFTLSANTAKGYPLIFVPTENELKIWKYENQWHCMYSLEGMPETQIWGPNKAAGYTKQYWLNMNIGDLNGDGFDDLVICEENKGKTLFNIYPQTKEGSFPSKPSQSFEDEWNWRTWICLHDVNKDGRIDVIKNKWLQEPWFLPGTYSGKVLVQIFISDADGDIPDKPAFTFRKNDWISSIPIVDIDGDGFMDLVLGYGMFDSREGARKSLTAKKLDHNLRIHFYHSDGFHKKPDCQKDITIYLGHFGMHLTRSRRHYLETQISVDGDFDGDGEHDLLVKDRKEQASVYFFISRKKGFSKKADMHFNDVKRVEQFIADDLNEDGISDLIVIGSRKDSFKVFLSKKK
ncbi:MAG TPA: VCBS repeat-containing protein [Sedimentisphaerales bacterium]|nr:VCBS repeat-containing protein [Sedimentisphaerales bacterium]